MSEPVNEKANLFYKDGSSDKVYAASIDSKDGLFVVNFAYGRRGAAQTTGTKTPKPVDWPVAKKVFDKLVSEKIAKGYKPSDASNVSIQTIAKSADERSTGMLPQLLNPIDNINDTNIYLEDDEWGMQEKHDGRRLMIKKEGKKITAANRKGQEIPLRKEIEDELSASNEDFIIDGEDCGTVFWAFDCLKVDMIDISATGFNSRWYRLCELIQNIHDNGIPQKFVRVSPLIKTTMVKWAEYKELKKKNAEGVVFKKLNAPYVAGRPNSGGNQLKFKFQATATCRVQKVNDRRSVGLEMKEGTFIGNVTIPSNHNIPNVGDLVEIRYLYAFKGGCLFQPVYLCKRDDIDHADALVSLKFKQGSENDDE